MRQHRRGRAPGAGRPEADVLGLVDGRHRVARGRQRGRELPVQGDALQRHQRLAQAVGPGAGGAEGVDVLPARQEAGQLAQAGEAQREEQERARRVFDVPRVDAHLKIAIECARRRPCQVEGGRARPSQVFEALHGAVHHRPVARQKRLLTEGIGGRDHRPRGLDIA